MNAGRGGPGTGNTRGDDHGELTADLRQLADAIFDRIDPWLAAAAQTEYATATAEDGSQTRVNVAVSSCAWCPVCALASVLRGENHELIAAMATHAAALLTIFRTLLDGGRPGTEPRKPASPNSSAASPTPPSAAGTSTPPAGGGYTPITVTITP